jgi:threonine dehydratase
MDSSDDLFDLRRALERIRDAARVVAAHVRRTPNVYSYTFSESAGCDVYLKLENLQRTGSFKMRGALNKIESLSPAERARGLVAASAGNHAQGVALAAKLAGSRATIVMPESTPLVKIQRTESYGAEVVLSGATYDDAQEKAREIASERGATLVHPFDDPSIIFGQGTVGLEVLEELDDLDTIVVPVGGGGLIAGIALAVKAQAPRVRIVGVQAAGSASMVRSIEAGRKITLEHPDTIADGIRVGTPGDLTLEVARRHVDEWVTVDEREIADAVAQTMEKSKVVAETAGVAAIAAVIAGKVRGGKRVCAIVSGGNIDLNLLARIIESGLASSGRYHLVRLHLRDVPGQLSTVLDTLSEARSNVLDVQHYRAGWKVPLGFVDVEILVETRRAGDAALIDAKLRERGFEVASDVEPSARH